ncbi:MAG: helix-turn-helix transcriptional regulator [Nocardioides sp.]|uniref:helix-turn-helix domain-containing protein n=1 Tax=Nocardioides sp. TaxID=35761 RepID=UPI0039E3A852
MGLHERLREAVGPTTARNIEHWAGNQVKLARIKADVSQREAAARAGVPHSTIARIESGTMQPSYPMLALILHALGYEVRARLEEFDDHDLVLDQRMEADPERHARAMATQDDFFAKARRIS